MRCHWIRIRHATRFALDSEADAPELTGSEPVLLVVHAENARAEVRIGELGSAWLPLRGTLAVETLDGPSRIERHRLRIFSALERPQIASREGSAFLGLIGNAAFWAQRDGGHRDLHGVLPLPELLGPDPLLTARCSDLLHAERLPPLRQRDAAADLHSLLLGAQRELLLFADACPGRRRHTRLQVLQRLLRARLRIECGEIEGLTLDDLSRVASYSLSHLVRTFHQVFGVTPHEFLIRERIRRAVDMLGSSSLAVGEVAHAVGVSNQSSFSRQLRARLGITASELRRQLQQERTRTRNAQRINQTGAMPVPTDS